jgi:hypothetical protein
MSKQQTAVKWLMNELTKHGSGAVRTFGELFEQAKEMEKEQMRLADKNGNDRSQYFRDLEYGGVEYWDKQPEPFEQYYNETFNK